MCLDTTSVQLVQCGSHFTNFTPPLWSLNVSLQSDREIGAAVRRIVVEHVHPGGGRCNQRRRAALCSC